MAIERLRPRVVLDTNIIVAAHLSRNPHSPTREILQRWQQHEFDLVYSDLVTYDPHFAVLGGSHRGVQIVDALGFLRILRGNPRT